MKHWMAIGAVAIMATGLTLYSSTGQADLVATPGLPAGWLSDGLDARHDTVAVARQRDSGEPVLVIERRGVQAKARPLAIYQTIDATPWRGRMMVFAAHTRIELDADTMRRTGAGPVAEIHVRCDGSQPATMLNVIRGSRTRRWLEMNLPVKVASDARRCTLGVVALAEAEIRLSRLKLKDPARELEEKLAHWRSAPAVVGSPGTALFAAKAQEMAASAASMAAPNLEFNQ